MRNPFQVISAAAAVTVACYGADAGPGRSGSAITIEAFVPKVAMLVGEPVVLVVRMRAKVPVYVEDQDDLAREDAHLRILVDRGAGFERYQQKRLLSSYSESPSKVTLENGVGVWEYVLAYDGVVEDWLFPQPGRYRLAVEYAEGKEVVRSKALKVEVAAPEGDEAVVLERVRKLPRYVLAPYPPGGELGPQLEPIVRDYPRSAYLEKVCLDQAEDRLTKAVLANQRPGRLDVEGGGRLALEEILVELQDIAANGGVFAADALLDCADIQGMLGNDDSARGIRARIAREFPGRSAARLAAKGHEEQ